MYFQSHFVLRAIAWCPCSPPPPHLQCENCGTVAAGPSNIYEPTAPLMRTVRGAVQTHLFLFTGRGARAACGRGYALPPPPPPKKGRLQTTGGELAVGRGRKGGTWGGGRGGAVCRVRGWFPGNFDRPCFEPLGMLRDPNSGYERERALRARVGSVNM